MKNSQQKAEKPKVVRKRTLPGKDLEVGAIAMLASVKWLSSNWLLLLWLNAAQFSIIVNNYNAVLRARNQAGGTKKSVVKSVELINIQINEALVYVKSYILDKFKKERAQSMYASFGIKSVNNNYFIPSDYEGRKEALSLMSAAVKEHFENKEYGFEFWNDIEQKYIVLADQSGTLSGQISVDVGTKNQLKKEVVLGLNALIKCIQANYPTTWKQELRNWGFQKERY